jgi:uncharacterized caspase-like protein
MLTRLALFASLVVASLAFVTDAKAERRVALVIGNAQYVHANTLRNPRNDATEMAVTLRKLGFDVDVGLDLDQQAFARTVDAFARKLDGADVALFFYAGHGVQINDKNYLVSVNAQLANEFLVSSETIELDSIVRLMESKVPVNIVFVDACRNNPLAEDLRKNLAALKRSAVLGRGLARMEATSRDTLIAFAAAPGQEAADGNARHSPFTTALLKHVPTPGLEVSVMLKRVSADVRELTNNTQRPQQVSDMSRTFYFAKAEPAVAAAQPQPAVTAPSLVPSFDERSLEVAFWNAAQNANQCEAVRAYLNRFPNGVFIELARLSEARLCSSGRRIDIVTPAQPAAPPQVAALPQPEEKPAISTPSAEDLTRPIQLELQRLGCEPGEVDGVWGDSSREAAARFKKRIKKASLDADEPSQTLLDALREKKGRVCPLECERGYRARGDRCVAIEREKPPTIRRDDRARERRRHRPAEAEVEVRPRRAPHVERHAPPAQRAPERCVIDLGYGRTANCDAGGGGR